MNYEELFEELDLEGDGRLSRDELHRAACLFGWYWCEAPLYALLDFLTIRGPLDRETFISCMVEVTEDPHGVYGRVLRRGPRWSGSAVPGGARAVGGEVSGVGDAVVCGGAWLDDITGLLQDAADSRAASDFRMAMERLNLGGRRVSLARSALLIIDPQRSFTEGEWMMSIGPLAQVEVMPIRLAFDRCARLLESLSQRLPVMLTRCPFPPGSYGWDPRLERIIDPAQLYFIKPGNNVLASPANGCREWVDGLIEHGVNTLVMGGCTLNSCLRVSAMAVRDAFQADVLDVVVDLGLCGARTGNYLASPLFEGLSPVESAIRQMTAAGVAVAEQVAWHDQGDGPAVS